MRWFFLGWTLCSVPLSGYAQSSEPNLTLQVRALLRSRCLECHSGLGRSSLAILDHGQLLRSDRPLPIVQPRKPEASLLLDLVAEGSMPPGIKPKLTADEVALLRNWIRTGAASFPKEFGERFVFETILQDMKSVTFADRKWMRYVSFAHLIGDTPQDLGRLTEEVAALREVLKTVSKATGDPLKPIETTGTLFRLNLKELGWDAQRFQRVPPRSPKEFEKWNLFDLVLLDYPQAMTYPASQLYDQVMSEVLVPMDQVRPVAYLHGDWLRLYLSHQTVREEMVRLIKYTPTIKRSPTDEPAPLFRPTKFESPLPVELPVGYHFDQGKLIPPIDSPAVHTFPLKKPPFDVEFEIVDAATRQPRRQFTQRQRFAFTLKSNRDVYVELYWQEIGGGRLQSLGDPLVKAYQPRLLDKVRDERGVESDLMFSDDIGTERLIFFASDEKFPPGELIRFDHPTDPIERLIHPLPLERSSDGRYHLSWDPNRMVKRTIEYTIVERPKK